jgi:hypothetical protein
VTEIDVNHRPRAHGVAKYGVHNRLWVGIADTFGVRWLSSRVVNPRVCEASEDSGAAGDPWTLDGAGSSGPSADSGAPGTPERSETSGPTEGSVATAKAALESQTNDD